MTKKSKDMYIGRIDAYNCGALILGPLIMGRKVGLDAGYFTNDVPSMIRKA